MKELLQHMTNVEKLQSISPSKIFSYTSQLLLNDILPYHQRCKRKSYLIERKLILMREIRQHTRQQYLLYLLYYSNIHDNDNQSIYSSTNNPSPPYHLAILPMEASFHSRIPLKSSKLIHLKMLRNSYYEMLQNVQNIQENIQKIHGMLSCTSVYHERAAGCLKCGGLIRQHELMVNSINRANGTMILVPYQYELEVSKTHPTPLATPPTPSLSPSLLPSWYHSLNYSFLRKSYITINHVKIIIINYSHNYKTIFVSMLFMKSNPGGQHISFEENLIKLNKNVIILIIIIVYDD